MEVYAVLGFVVWGLGIEWMGVVSIFHAYV